jgi:hypothetical protein
MRGYVQIIIRCVVCRPGREPERDAQLRGLLMVGPFQILAAVLAGNAITVVWLYTLWRIGRREAVGREATVFQCLMAAVPPGLMAYGFWLIR